MHAEDGTLKGCGIEIIARDVVVTDNVVDGGAMTGLSVSNTRVKNNVFWARNTVRDCVQWGAQFQGETGGIADHYFHDCRFEKTRKGNPRAGHAGADCCRSGSAASATTRPARARRRGLRPAWNSWGRGSRIEKQVNVEP